VPQRLPLVASAFLRVAKQEQRPNLPEPGAQLLAIYAASMLDRQTLKALQFKLAQQAQYLAPLAKQYWSRNRYYQKCTHTSRLKANRNYNYHNKLDSSTQACL
jgi:hypothetical protein